MEQESLVECSFLIPVLRNTNRAPHEPITWREFQNELQRMSKDFSGPQTHRIVPFMEVETVPGQCAGVPDESRKYFLAVPKNRLKDIRSFLEAQLTRFDQESIYLAVAGAVEFIERGAPSSPRSQSSQIGAQENESISTDHGEASRPC